MTTKAQLKLAKELFERFFRDAEGRAGGKIDIVFTLEDMRVSADKAEPSLEYLESRGCIKMFDDSAVLTEFGVEVGSEEKDISALPKYVASWGGGAPPPASPSAVEKAPAPAQTAPAAPRPKKPRLTFIDPEGKTHVIELVWSIVMGRSDEASLKLPDPRASKKHCEVSFQNDHYQLKDLGSANGTMVNGQYIETYRLNHLDMIIIGRTELLYECPEVLSTPAGVPEDSQPKKMPGAIPPMAPPEKSFVPPPKSSTVKEAAKEEPTGKAEVTRPPPVKREELKREEPKREEPKREEPKREEPKREERREMKPSFDDTARPAKTSEETTLRPPTKEEMKPAERTKSKEEPRPEPRAIKERQLSRGNDATVEEAPRKLPPPGPKRPLPSRPASTAQPPVKIVKGEPASPPSRARPKGKATNLFGDEGKTGEPDSLFADTADVKEERDDVLIPPSARPSGGVLFGDDGSASEGKSAGGEAEDVDLFADTGDLGEEAAEATADSVSEGGNLFAREREPVTQSGPRPKKGKPAPEPEELASEDVMDMPDAPARLDARGSHAFEETLVALRRKAEHATIPDRDELLDALDLIRKHPYIRAALSQM